MSNDFQRSDDFYNDPEVKEAYAAMAAAESVSPKERLEQLNAELIARGIFPVPEEYQSDVPTGMESVEANPTRYIVSECIPACKELWGKNIYTFMVCDLIDLEAGWVWICVKDTVLSDRNREILASLDRTPGVIVDTTDTYYENAAYIKVELVGQAAQDALLDIAKRFEMQDVPEGYAYRKYETGESIRAGEMLAGKRIYFSRYHWLKHLEYARSQKN